MSTAIGVFSARDANVQVNMFLFMKIKVIRMKWILHMNCNKRLNGKCSVELCCSWNSYKCSKRKVLVWMWLVLSIPWEPLILPYDCSTVLLFLLRFPLVLCFVWRRWSAVSRHTPSPSYLNWCHLFSSYLRELKKTGTEFYSYYRKPWTH